MIDKMFYILNRIFDALTTECLSPIMVIGIAGFATIAWILVSAYIKGEPLFITEYDDGTVVKYTLRGKVVEKNGKA